MANALKIESFDDLLEVGLAQSEPQRLLVLLLKADPDDSGNTRVTEESVQGSGTLTPIMGTDIELTEEVRLDALAEEADSTGHAWDLLMVTSLSGRDGQLPDSATAEPYLKAMAEAVQTGSDLSRYAIFDRSGSPVRLQTQE